MKALAHISEDGTRTQTVQEHLTGTAKLAGALPLSSGHKTKQNTPQERMISENTRPIFSAGCMAVRR